MRRSPGPVTDRWHGLTLVEQLANMASEFSRFCSWHERHRADAAEESAGRFLALLDLTIADPRWRGRERELTRLREVSCDLFSGGQTFHVTARMLQGYFMPFALAARR